jgi:hypothetical protein
MFHKFCGKKVLEKSKMAAGMKKKTILAASWIFLETFFYIICFFITLKKCNKEIENMLETLRVMLKKLDFDPPF